MPVTNLAMCSPELHAQILNRGKGSLAILFPAVDAIIARVRSDGDRAVRELTLQFDHADVATLAVPPEQIQSALQRVDPAYVAALHRASASIEAFHQAQLPRTIEPAVETVPGVQVWREWRAIERIGIYVPGGLALYPSCLLMGSIPARIAGCSEIIVCTPPAPDGSVPDALLAAAAVACNGGPGVPAVHIQVFAIGGAQAIAAMAYGTESVPRVDKIVGPGSSYVAAAKLRVSADIAIDMPAGPSEVLIIADDTATPAWIASDLLAQAEHGPESACVLVATSRTVAAEVQAELTRQIQSLATRETIAESFRRNGAILVADTLEDAIVFANDYAAEHLEIVTRDPQSVATQIIHAGSVFLGGWSPVAAGDYATGGNHTLPTARFARSFAPLSVEAFGRWLQFQRVTPQGLDILRETITTLARTERLVGHAASITSRFANPERHVEQMESHVVPPILLNANENPYGPSPLARRVLSASITAAARYPDAAQTRLREALAARYGVRADQIVIGNGSDELIRMIDLTYIQAGDAILTLDPTFSMYAIEAAHHGAATIAVPLDAAFQIDRAALLNAITPRTRIAWLCSPNNPTGNLLDCSIIPELAAKVPIVVMDEAYYPFGDATALSMLSTIPNLIILRTFSKAAGLAGLRIGFGIASPAVIAAISQRRQIFNVNTLAVEAALAALADEKWIAATRQTLDVEREHMMQQLATLPDIRVWPSVANFFLIEFPGRHAKPIYDALAARDMHVRYLPTPRLRNFLRVTVGLPTENDRFIALLQTILMEVPA